MCLFHLITILTHSDPTVRDSTGRLDSFLRISHMEMETSHPCGVGLTEVVGVEGTEVTLLVVVVRLGSP